MSTNELDSLALKLIAEMREQKLGKMRIQLNCGSYVTVVVKELRPTEERCAYPIACNGKRLRGLTMCKRHQPFPLRTS